MLDFYFSNPQQVIKYSHKKNQESVNWDYHLHDYFEIYFLIKGDTDYFVDKKVYSLSPGDIIIIRDDEIHTHCLKNKENYERFLILFDSNIANFLSSPDFNLLKCFTNRPIGEQNKITLSLKQREDLVKLFYKFEALNSNTPGTDILKLSYFLEVLVIINNAFTDASHVDEGINVPPKLLPILKYIDENLNGDLSLETLEKNFFINRFYLTRLFKKSTGLSLHKYIILKRVLKAKELLSEGLEVIKVCNMTGFNDYTNFIKMFKSIVKVTPSVYRKNKI